MSEEGGVDTPKPLVGDRYRLVRLVGRGGMGAVWEGYDERLRRPVALKLLHVPPGLPDDEAEQATGRAMREAQLVARLEHRNAVSIYDVTEYEGQPCLVMEYVPSHTLAEALKEVPYLRERGAADIGAQVASALAAAHAAGIVHRDVKPANILVADDGTARISDFGIAHALGGDSTLTSTGMITGTPAYLAPEVARGGDSGYASDVYSLGSTLYTALEGRPPFGSEPNPMRLLHKVASGQLEPPQRAGALTPLLTRMMAPDPGDRPTMAEVAHELGRVAAGDPVPPVTEPTRTLPAPPQDAPARPIDPVRPDPVPLEPLPPARPSADPAPRRRWLLPVIVALLVLALVVAAFVLLRPSGQGTPTVQPSTSASTSAPPSTAPSSSAPPATTSTPAPTSPPPSSSAPAPSPSTSSAAPGPPTAQQLAGAISTYYTLVPGNLDQAWALLTPSYQSGTAGSRATFDRFWGGFASVSATDVTGTPPGTVTALITYTTKDGKVTKERTTFGLVDDGGVLKINSSTVTSSS